MLVTAFTVVPSRSGAVRTFEQRTVLEQFNPRCVAVSLSGYIFFGSSVTISDKVMEVQLHAFILNLPYLMMMGLSYKTNPRDQLNACVTQARSVSKSRLLWLLWFISWCLKSHAYLCFKTYIGDAVEELNCELHAAHAAQDCVSSKHGVAATVIILLADCFNCVC